MRHNEITDGTETEMITAKQLKLTPRDHGREIDPDDFEHSDGEEGYHYEIINGRVYVSPLPNHPADSLERWLFDLLHDYYRQHPDVIKYLSSKTRVWVHDRPKATCPEPDIAAFSDYPDHLPRRERRWQDISPILVVEVLSENTPDKDLVRNVELYEEVPSIKEYWILDPRPDPDQPSLIVYRRRGKSWQKPIHVAFGETYETPRLLPGFKLLVNPDA